MDSLQDHFIDDLLADSLQAASYLRQMSCCHLQVFTYDYQQWMGNYLKRYWAASPEIQLQIFLFSGFSAPRREVEQID